MYAIKHLQADRGTWYWAVHFLRSERQPQGAWQAKIKLADGRKLTKSFSIRRFGRRRAFELAVDARHNMVALVEDRPYLYHQTARKLAALGRSGSTSANSARRVGGFAGAQGD